MSHPIPTAYRTGYVEVGRLLRSQIRHEIAKGRALGHITAADETKSLLESTFVITATPEWWAAMQQVIAERQARIDA